MVVLSLQRILTCDKIPKKSTVKEITKVPNIKSAKKRVLVIDKKTAENKSIVSEVKTAIKKFNGYIQAEDIAAAEEALKNTISLIDAAASKNIFHKNNASNKKAKLSKKLDALKKKNA